MNVYGTGAYIILQIFSVNVYIPLYAIEDPGDSIDRIVLNNVKVESRDTLELLGSPAGHEGEDRVYHLDELSIHKVGGREDGIVYGGRIGQGVAFGTTASDFSMMKAVLEHTHGKDRPVSLDFPSEIRIKSVEMKVPLVIQVFLHMPIVLVAVITFYLFLSFGIDDRGLSEKEIERIPLYLYSEQESASKGCSICLEDFEDSSYVRRLSCDHIFHRECVDRWFHRNFVCPICRNKMSARDDGMCNGDGVHVL